MATKCAINGRQWGAYDGRRQLYANIELARTERDAGMLPVS